MHACSCGNKLRQKTRNLEKKTEKTQRDNICSACFTSLAHFTQIVKNMFLDIYNMLNHKQL